MARSFSALMENVWVLESVSYVRTDRVNRAMVYNGLALGREGAEAQSMNFKYMSVQLLTCFSFLRLDCNCRKCSFVFLLKLKQSCFFPADTRRLHCEPCSVSYSPVISYVYRYLLHGTIVDFELYVPYPLLTQLRSTAGIGAR